MDSITAAHIRDDGAIQTILQHCLNTAEQTRIFAESFGCGGYGYFCGMLHDIGKYSREFQNRIRGANNMVDHSTAGALESFNALPKIGLLFSYCIAGHHSGLPDGGSKADVGIEATLNGRLKRKDLPDYSGFKRDFDIASFTPPISQPIQPLEKYGFSYSFFIRMLFSCLVDADFLDTEAFMTSGRARGTIVYSIEDLYKKMLAYIRRFNEPKNTLHEKRNEILQSCLERAELPKGLFTLTVPTGGGKTVSPLAFALRHAKTHDMKRVIYVIPYTSIIEQNASVFKQILGEEYILEHHSNFNYNDNDETMTRYRLATENWDMPVVVTTNVQFFESLFANKTSKCRKLHNIANSVIIFDEAQMFPTEYLLPCIRAISELVHNYGCTAVLCSATQPALSKLFPKMLTPIEIHNNTAETYRFFQRATIINIGKIEDNALAERLNNEEQCLCIVNTKRHAQELFSQLEPEGRYHLSTFMCPKHRKIVLQAIKERLTSKHILPCRVVSTSLIEAGVDVDFPTVYRATAGLDSQIQAAGRCNREGKRRTEHSIVSIFEPADKYIKYQPAAMKRPIEIARSISRQYQDIAAPEAIRSYFEQLYQMTGQGLDAKEIVKRFEDAVDCDYSFPFASVADEFKLIDQASRPIVIPYDKEADDLIKKLRSGEKNQKLFRDIQQYTVNVYPDEYEALLGTGCVEPVDTEIAVLKDGDYYHEYTGLTLPAKGGLGLFF